MPTGLSALTSFESLLLHFECPSLETQRPSPPPPPPTFSTFPNLTEIEFNGASKYLEEILAWIDAPQLDDVFITFFHQITFDAPQLFQFISRSPILRAPEKGCIAFNYQDIIARFSPHYYYVFILKIPYTASGWRLSSLKRLFTSSLPPVSMLKDLYIDEDHPCWPEDVEDTPWSELLHPFAAAKNLYLCEEFVSHIAPTLQELSGEE